MSNSSLLIRKHLQPEHICLSIINFLCSINQSTSLYWLKYFTFIHLHILFYILLIYSTFYTTSPTNIHYTPKQTFLHHLFSFDDIKWLLTIYDLNLHIHTQQQRHYYYYYNLLLLDFIIIIIITWWVSFSFIFTFFLYILSN